MRSGNASLLLTAKFRMNVIPPAIHTSGFKRRINEGYRSLRHLEPQFPKFPSDGLLSPFEVSRIKSV